MFWAIKEDSCILFSVIRRQFLESCTWLLGLAQVSLQPSQPYCSAGSSPYPGELQQAGTPSTSYYLQFYGKIHALCCEACFLK